MPNTETEQNFTFDTFFDAPVAEKTADTPPEIVVPPIPGTEAASSTEPIKEVTKENKLPEAPTEEAVAQDTPLAEPQVERTTWSNLALSMRDTDKMLPEDVEIPDTLSPEDLKTLLYESVKKSVLSENASDIEALTKKEKNRLIEKGLSAEQIEQGLFYSQFMAEGGSSQTVERHSYLDALANYELESVEEKIQMIQKFQELRGQDEALVNSFIEKEFTFGEEEAEESKNAKLAKLNSLAKQSQEKIGELRDYEFQQEKERAKAQKAANEEAISQERKAYDKIINEGFLGIKLRKEEADKLRSAMYDTDSYKNIQTPQGIQQIPETVESKAWEKIMSDPEKRVAFAYIAINGIESLVNNAHKKANDAFIKAIEEKPKPQVDTSILDRSTPKTPKKPEGADIFMF